MLDVLVAEVRDAADIALADGYDTFPDVRAGECRPFAAAVLGVLTFVTIVEMHDFVSQTYDIEQFLLARREVLLLHLLFPEGHDIVLADVPDIVGVDVEDGFQYFFVLFCHSVSGRNLLISCAKVGIIIDIAKRFG